MSWSGKCTLILTVIITIALCNLTPHIKSYQKDIDLSNDEWKHLFTSLSENNFNLFYGSCVNTSSTAGVCKVSTITSPVHTNQSDFQKTCTFFNPNPSFTDAINNLLPLDHDSVLLEKYQYNADINDFESIVHLIRISDCRSVPLSLPNTVLPWKQALKSQKNDNTFDLFYSIFILYKTLKSEMDCENNICRVTYNMDGEVVGEPRVFVQRPETSMTETWTPMLSPNLIDSNAIYFQKIEPDRGFYRVSQDGTPSLLYSYDGYTNAFISNSKISVCQKWSNGNVVCRQYDSGDNDRLLVNVKFNISDYSDKDPVQDVNLVAHNPREGGLVLAIAEHVESSGGYKLLNLKLVRVRPDGQLSPALVIPYEKSNFTSFWEHKFVEDAKQICLKMTPDERHLTFSVECVAKSYFYQL